MKGFIIGLAGLLLSAIGTVAAAQGYGIQPGDTLRVEVLEDSSLNRNVLVLPDGSVNFPMAGTIKASGRSVAQVQSAIASALASNFAAPPSVYVTVAGLAIPSETAARKLVGIYAMGEVARPGLIEVEPGTTLLQAVAQAGGFTRFAATKRVELRRVVDGAEKAYVFNYKKGGGIPGSTKLQAGDVIVVHERGLFE